MNKIRENFLFFFIGIYALGMVVSSYFYQYKIIKSSRSFFSFSFIFSPVSSSINALIWPYHTFQYFNKDKNLLKNLDKQNLTASLLKKSSADISKIPPLHLASRQGNLKTLSKLLTKEFDINREDSSGLTALHVAVLSNQLNSASLLIRNNADVNSQSLLGITPIILAVTEALGQPVSKDKLTMIDLLLKNGANPNAIFINGLTPLHLAVYKNDLGIAYLLIVSGANLNIKDQRGNSPLNLAKTQETKNLLRSWQITKI